MSHLSAETAVIPAGGAATRFLPTTTYLSKSMVPVREPKPGAEGKKHQRPAIAYALDECAGNVGHVILVTTEQGREQFKDYFTRLHPDTREHLQNQGKSALLEEELDRRAAYRKLFDFEFIIQKPEDGYGTTVPLHLARHAISGEGMVAYWGGDDAIYHQDGTSEMGLAIATRAASGANHAIVGLPVEPGAAPNYGILAPNEQGYLAEWREKPQDNIPPRPLANVCRYLLNVADVQPLVAAEMQTNRRGEHLFTHVVNAALSEGQSFAIHEASGHYAEIGDLGTLEVAEGTLAAFPRQVEIVRELAEI